MKLPKLKILFAIMIIAAAMLFVILHYHPINPKYKKPAQPYKYGVIRQTPSSSDVKLRYIWDRGKAPPPPMIDLRSIMVPAYNQGSLGSCTAQAGVGCRVYWIIAERGKSPELSRLFLYYMERKLEGNAHRDSGATMRSICQALHQFGVCEEKLWPYRVQNFSKNPSDKTFSNALNYKISSYYAIDTLEEIKDYLAAIKRPVLVGMEVYESFESYDLAETGKMIMPKPEEKMLGGHAVMVMGYDDTKDILIVRNSWGENWGTKGYFFMPYDYARQNHIFDFWVIQTSN